MEKKITKYLVACILLGLFLLSGSCNSGFSDISLLEVSSPKYSESLYFKVYSWGLDGSLTYISMPSRKWEKPDEKYDIIYSSEMSLYFRFREDTLDIFTAEIANIPETFLSVYFINQQKYSELGARGLIRDVYEDFGLKRFDFHAGKPK